jgi:hypothetical protein
MSMVIAPQMAKKCITESIRAGGGESQISAGIQEENLIGSA